MVLNLVGDDQGAAAEKSKVLRVRKWKGTGYRVVNLSGDSGDVVV